jgi:hypothetical protein
MLLWRTDDSHNLEMDLVVFTDVGVLRMIAAAATPRSAQSIALIDASLSQFSTTGKMVYKERRSATVAHQKVSLFPLRDIPALADRMFAFPIKSTDIVLKPVRPDISLWQEIDKARIKAELNAQHAKQIAELNAQHAKQIADLHAQIAELHAQYAK